MNKRTFTYPGSDLDRGRALLATLGTFWSRTYTAKDQLLSYTSSVGVLAAQNYHNILEVVQSLSRFDVPVFHKEYWVPIVLRKSELSSTRVINNFFDATPDRFDLTQSLFDGVLNTDLFYFTAPKNLSNLGQIFNKIIYPTVALIENVDYIIDAKSQAIVFVDNPFDNPGFLRKPVTSGSDTDEEIVLWGFNGGFDYENVFNQFAYALGLRLKSSQGYKDLMNAVFDGLLAGGATCADLDLAFSAICGIPLTIEDRETIEVVDYDTHGVLIVSDKHAYRFGDRATPIVEVGQQVRAGTQLVRGFEIDEFFVGNTYDPLVRNADPTCCPAPNNVLATNNYADLLTEGGVDLLLDPNAPVCNPKKALTALALDRGFLSACFYGDLVFENKEVPLVVDTTRPDGFTYVSFKIAGLPQDVEHFFEEIHARGRQAAMHATPCETGVLNIRGTAVNWPPAANPTQNDTWIVGVMVPPNAPENTEPGHVITWRGVQWKNLGPASDVFKHSEQKQQRYTLAHFLDKRKNRISEPDATHLPATINPLRFMVENVLRNNVFVVKLTLAALGRNRLGLYNIRHLRPLLPPGTAMLLMFDLEVPPNTINGNNSIHEETHFFIGAEPAADVIDASLIRDAGVTVRSLSGSCQ